MAIQSTRPLTTTQAVEILEALSLLTSKQHKNSKLVIYETKIELESDSSTWRTLSSLASSPAVSTLRYYAGYSAEETGSRDVADLPPLLERVHQAFKTQKSNFDEVSKNKKRIELAEKALEGLVSLVQHEYLDDLHKTGLVELAQQKVKDIVDFMKKNAGFLRFDYEDTHTKQLRAKETQIETLTRENSNLNKLLGEKERYIAVLSQLFEKQKTKISKLQDAIVQGALTDPVEVDEVSTPILLARIHTLTGVVFSRQH